MFQVYRWDKVRKYGKIVKAFDDKQIAENYAKAMTKFENDKDIEYRIW